MVIYTAIIRFTREKKNYDMKNEIVKFYLDLSAFIKLYQFEIHWKWKLACTLHNTIRLRRKLCNRDRVNRSSLRIFQVVETSRVVAIVPVYVQIARIIWANTKIWKMFLLNFDELCRQFYFMNVQFFFVFHVACFHFYFQGAKIINEQKKLLIFFRMHHICREHIWTKWDGEKTPEYMQLMFSCFQVSLLFSKTF